MTISTQAAAVTAITDGSTTVFNFNFEIPYQSDGITAAVSVHTIIAGVVTHLTLDTDYTIAGVGNPAGGSITTEGGSSPIPSGLIVIQRRLNYTQPDAFPNQSLEPQDIETALDSIVMLVQQLVYTAGFPPGPFTVSTLPTNPLPSQWAWVSDCVSTTNGAVAVGGGANNALVFYTGAAWVAVVGGAR